MAVIFNSTADINAHVAMAQKAGPGVINPETFYSKQLLDTIRYDADQYVYHKLADEAPIQEKADKLMIRRWAPLQAHTVPLTEGVPPKSDKGSVEKYEMTAHQYGRYMEFTDKVDFKVVDPVIAHYTKEYSLVALETLDLLARETLFSIAQKRYAGGAANFEELNMDSKPTLTDLRLIVLDLKKSLVKPRSNGAYHVIGSPEFYFDMISDPIVEKYMSINKTTSTMYEHTKLVKLFDLEFYETLIVPTSGEFIKNGVKSKRFYKVGQDGSVEYQTVAVKTTEGQEGYYAIDQRTGAEASYIPYANGIKEDYVAPEGFQEFKVQHILVVGKDALTRTGPSGEGQAKMYVKAKGSSGVLDPIDQRQSIGFKINSVGYGCTRLEAVYDYICVPTEVNI
jgi:hypothetical protein